MAATHAFVRTEDAPRLPPPARSIGIVGWLRENLFSSPANTAMTILSIALMGVAAMGERQQHQFEVLGPAFGGASLRGRDHAGRLVGDRVDEGGERHAALGVPQVDEALVLQLAPEQRADAGAAEPERMAGRALELENEDVAKRLADGARFDLAAFGRCPCSAPRDPIAEQLAA